MSEVQRCVVEVGHLNGNVADWYDSSYPTMTVCDRHKSQYDERDDLGPFDWRPLTGVR